MKRWSVDGDVCPKAPRECVKAVFGPYACTLIISNKIKTIT